MRIATPKLALVMTLTAALCPAPAAVAQDARDEQGLWNYPGITGLLPTTPSRMRGSKREMNRGREAVWNSHMTPSQVQTYAEQAVERAGFRCKVADSAFVARQSDGTPIVEVHCEGTGGLIIANSDPIQATDCLDLPLAGMPVGSGDRIDACRLPGNVAMIPPPT